MDKAKLKNRGVVAAATIYDNSQQSRRMAKDVAVAIFTDRPYLRDILLDCFVHTWAAVLEVGFCVKFAD
jgi:hypothetical protein